MVEPKVSKFRVLRANSGIEGGADVGFSHLNFRNRPKRAFAVINAAKAATAPPSALAPLLEGAVNLPWRGCEAASWPRQQPCQIDQGRWEPRQGVEAHESSDDGLSADRSRHRRPVPSRLDPPAFGQSLDGDPLGKPRGTRGKIVKNPMHPGHPGRSRIRSVGIIDNENEAFCTLRHPRPGQGRRDVFASSV